MCRALRVLCAAGDDGRLAELKRASVGVHWELVGGATSERELVEQAAEWDPDVVVIDGELGPEVADRFRAASPRARVIMAGPGIDAGDIRASILGVPGPGGPVRRSPHPPRS